MISFQYKPQTAEEVRDLFDTYYQSLSKSEITDKQFTDVAGRIVLSWKPDFGRKFPSVKEFVDIAGVSASVIAEKAYNGIRGQIIEHGYNGQLFLSKSPAHRHHVAFKVISIMGGWVAITTAGVKKYNERKDEFIKLYQDFYYKEVPRVEYLLGSSDLSNERFLANYNSNQITKDN